jgi:SAM-dependent methyltransferase
LGKQFKIGSLYVNISRQAIPVEKWGCLIYRCNICGQFCESKVTDLGREAPSCPACGSTVRMRAIIHLLSLELFGQSLALPNFPVKPEIRGIGLSDWEGYAIPLAHKLNYTNTYYHQEPRLDIMAIDSALEGTLDFLISTEVFEHVPPPVSVAFANAYRLLKPCGVLIFTVPYTKEGQTLEHFPELHDYAVIEQNGQYCLKNITTDGREQLFESLVFHGGAGSTLEMRVFAEQSLKEEFSRVGFQHLKVHPEPTFEYGIYWSHDWSLPMIARKCINNDENT